MWSCSAGEGGQFELPIDPALHYQAIDHKQCAELVWIGDIHTAIQRRRKSPGVGLTFGMPRPGGSWASPQGRMTLAQYCSLVIGGCRGPSGSVRVTHLPCTFPLSLQVVC